MYCTVLNTDGEKLAKLSHTVGDYNCTHRLLYKKIKKKKTQTEYLFVYSNEIQDWDTIAKYLTYDWGLQLINY